jgi:hypothetical protein
MKPFNRQLSIPTNAADVIILPKAMYVCFADQSNNFYLYLNQSHSLEISVEFRIHFNHVSRHFFTSFIIDEYMLNRALPGAFIDKPNTK